MKKYAMYQLKSTQIGIKNHPKQIIHLNDNYIMNVNSLNTLKVSKQRLDGFFKMYEPINSTLTLEQRKALMEYERFFFTKLNMEKSTELIKKKINGLNEELEIYEGYLEELESNCNLLKNDFSKSMNVFNEKHDIDVKKFIINKPIFTLKGLEVLDILSSIDVIELDNSGEITVKLVSNLLPKDIDEFAEAVNVDYTVDRSSLLISETVEIKDFSSFVKMIVSLEEVIPEDNFEKEVSKILNAIKLGTVLRERGRSGIASIMNAMNF